VVSGLGVEVGDGGGSLKGVDGVLLDTGTG
jgi:hypothetical protein